ncbi:uncharacterized protein si:ch211-57f7.7 isoform X1 [Danio rerio]|uniref:Uncharacterized protein si:ch211-57f7.7 isoform X1 n=3 Tax=Danio rerio TaxID=7955 RepID=A0AC58H2C8_DANRE
MNSDSANLTDAINILRNVLASPTIIRSISNSVDSNASPSAELQTETESELRNLFRPSRAQSIRQSMSAGEGPRYHTRQQYGNWQSRSRKRPRGQYHQTFNKDVILLTSPNDKNVVKQRKKQRLHEIGHILNAFEFEKAWDSTMVLRRIKEGFKEKVPFDVSLEILMGCGNKLIKPQLTEGQELDGRIILKVFRLKALYVRPSRPLLLTETDCSDDSCFEVDMPGESIHQSPGTASDENMNTDFNDQSSTQNSSSTRVQSSTRTQFSTSFSSAQPSTSSSDTQPFTSFSGVQPFTSSSSVLPSTSSSGTQASTSSSSLPPSTNSRGLQPSTLSSGAQPSTSGQLCTRRNAPAQSWNTDQSFRSASWDGDYDTYISLLRGTSEDEEEDEDLCCAIMASIEDQIFPPAVEIPIKEILEELASKINGNQTCKFNINRASVLDGAIRGFTRMSYSPNNRMVIRFSDDKGKFEEAVDLGGPRREFLRLLLVALMESSMFDGKEGSINLALDSQAMREDRYFIAGRAVAVSLVHGGPAPGCFSKTLYDSLVQGPDMCRPGLEDVADPEIYSKIKKLSEASTVEELRESTEPIMDFLANAGCLRPIKNIDDKDRLVEDLLMFQVVNRVRGPFERFRDGLKTLGVLAKVQQHPESFRSLFCHQPKQLTADMMDDLFEIQWSEIGSNKRANENRVIAFWRDYLQDVEEEGAQRLGAILSFTTGSDHVPPIGFHPQPSIAFHHDSELLQRFPIANTCINCLRLPLYSTYGAFKSNMEFAINNTHGFGKE